MQSLSPSGVSGLNMSLILPTHLQFLMQVSVVAVRAQVLGVLLLQKNNTMLDEKKLKLNTWKT